MYLVTLAGELLRSEKLFVSLNLLRILEGILVLTIHGRITKRTYAGLLNRVKDKLASWKSRTLSLAGRLTLIKVVNSAIPIYSMQTAKLPASICDSLDRINREFL